MIVAKAKAAAEKKAAPEKASKSDDAAAKKAADKVNSSKPSPHKLSLQDVPKPSCFLFLSRLPPRRRLPKRRSAHKVISYDNYCKWNYLNQCCIIFFTGCCREEGRR